MIEIMSNRGSVEVTCEGPMHHLLTDLTIGTAKCLLAIIGDENEDCQKTITKSFFENVLYSMKVMAGEAEIK